MYINMMGGCSSLLHLLAARPSLILAAGLILAVSGSVTPVGPGSHQGAAALLEALENEQRTKNPALDALILEASKSFARMRHHALSDAAIESVLKAVDPCTDLTVRDVRANHTLYQHVRWLYFCDLVSKTQNVYAAEVLYLREQSP